MTKPYLSEADTRRIKAAIVGAGHSLASVADALGMSRATLSAKVNGRSDFSRSEMEAIARLLHVPPSEIFLPSSCI